LKGALILAGGKSTRFRGNKALARLRGKPLIDYVAHTAAQVADEVVVAIGRESGINVYRKLLPTSVHIIQDQLREKSPLVGIVTGFQAMKSEYSVVLSCDTPFVKDDVLKLLFKKAVRSDAAIPKWPNGDIEPLQSIYKIKSAIPAAKRALSKHEFRNSDMIKRLTKVTYVPVQEIRRVDETLITFFNVNKRADLRRATSLLEGVRVCVGEGCQRL
jgi:molybdopterin-guanine dinucleotide biosynthesis protein A